MWAKSAAIDAWCFASENTAASIAANFAHKGCGQNLLLSTPGVLLLTTRRHRLQQILSRGLRFRRIYIGVLQLRTWGSPSGPEGFGETLQALGLQNRRGHSGTYSWEPS